MTNYKNSLWHNDFNNTTTTTTTNNNLDKQQQEVNQKNLIINNNILTNPILQYDYICCCLSYIADICAKQQKSGPCIIAWYKLKQFGIIPRENCISTYMYVFSLINNKNNNNKNTSAATTNASIQQKQIENDLKMGSVK